MTFPALRAKNMRPTILLAGEVRIERKRLEDLERKERAHDAYLEAAQRMRRSGVTLYMVNHAIHHPEDEYSAGWTACLREFEEAVVTAGRER